MRFDSVQEPKTDVVSDDDSFTSLHVAVDVGDGAITPPRGGSRSAPGIDGRGHRKHYADGSGFEEDDENDDPSLIARKAPSGRTAGRVSPHVVAGGGHRKGKDTRSGLFSSPIKQGVYVRPSDGAQAKMLNSRAAMRLFELLWTILAIFFIAQLLNMTGYIPKHTKQASNLIQQSKVWMAGGEPTTEAWSKINSKSELLDTLNSTVFMGMFRTHLTHLVFHDKCKREYNWTRRLESETSPYEQDRQLEDEETTKGDLPAAYKPGDNVSAIMECDDLPTMVPHRGGLWMFTVSSDPKENQVGCPVEHDPQERTIDKGAWNEQYKIGGTLGTYSLPDSCTASKTMEIMQRLDNPDITITNGLVEWVDANFRHHTQALIVLVQLYFEPAMKWDTFGTLLIEKDMSGRFLTSDYFLARDYRPAQDVHETRKRSGFYRAIIFIMLAIFAWWAGGTTKAIGSEPSTKRFVALALFPWPFFQCFTAVGEFPGQMAVTWVVALPYLLYTGTCIIASMFKSRYNTLSNDGRKSNNSETGKDSHTGGVPPSTKKDDSGLVLPADSKYLHGLTRDNVPGVDVHTHTTSHTHTHTRSVAGGAVDTDAEEVKGYERDERGTCLAPLSDSYTPPHTRVGARSITKQPLLRSVSEHNRASPMLHELHAAGKGRARSHPLRSAASAWAGADTGDTANYGSPGMRGVGGRAAWAQVAQEYATDVCVFVFIVAVYVMVPLVHNRPGAEFFPYVLWLLHIVVRVSARIWEYQCRCRKRSSQTESDDRGTHETLTQLGSLVVKVHGTEEQAAPTRDYTSHVESTAAWDMVDIFLVLCSFWMFVAYAEFVHNAVNIRSKWQLSAETAAFMASRGAWLSVPFSLVLFLVIVRTLRYLEIFPILAVPWATFTRCLHELLAYSVVFVIITISFSLLFMYNLGGDLTGVSGLGRAMMTMMPNILGGNIQFLTSGVPTKQFIVLLINSFYAFTTVFFVTNILLALVLAHYEGARTDSGGLWIDHNLLEYVKDKIQAAKRVAPHRAKLLLDRLETRVEMHSMKLRRKSSMVGESGKQSVDFVPTDPEAYGWDLARMPTWHAAHQSSAVMGGSVYDGASPTRLEQIEKQLSIVQQAMKRQESDRSKQQMLLERMSSLLESIGAQHSISQLRSAALPQTSGDLDHDGTFWDAHVT